MKVLELFYSTLPQYSKTHIRKLYDAGVCAIYGEDHWLKFLPNDEVFKTECNQFLFFRPPDGVSLFNPAEDRVVIKMGKREFRNVRWDTEKPTEK